MRLWLQHHRSSPRRLALPTMAVLTAAIAAPAAANGTTRLLVVPREDLVDGHIVEISVTGAPARASLSLDTCVETAAGLACSERGRTVRILPSGDFGPVTEKVRTIIVTDAGRFDCREQAASSPCLFVLHDRMRVLASAPLTFRSAAPLESEPTLTITPAADLQDAQTVSVFGAGFDLSIHTGVRQCRAGSTDQGDCRPSGRAPSTSGTGTLKQEVMVYAGFGTIYDEWVDCAVPSSCELVVFAGRVDGAPVRVPLAFAEGSRVAAPSITITPNRALRPDQHISVSGSGFSPNATLAIEQYLMHDAAPSRWRQLIANGFIATTAQGTFATQLMVRTETSEGAEVCTTAESACVLVVREAQGRYGVAKTTLDFAR